MTLGENLACSSQKLKQCVLGVGGGGGGCVGEVRGGEGGWGWGPHKIFVHLITLLQSEF